MIALLQGSPNGHVHCVELSNVEAERARIEQATGICLRVLATLPGGVYQMRERWQAARVGLTDRYFASPALMAWIKTLQPDPAAAGA